MFEKSHLDFAQAISVDVFDTILLRSTRSEQERIAQAAQKLSRIPSVRGHNVRLAKPGEIRLLAQALAYRALGVGGGASEVRLHDIFERKLAILGLPSELSANAIAIEVAIENQSLRPNRKLVEALRKLKASGKRIIAASDTALPQAALVELIDDFVGEDLFDGIYSSAEAGATKRFGGLFEVVARESGLGYGALLHVGDDEVADVEVPASLGIRTRKLVRSPLYKHVRRLRGGSRVAARKAWARAASMLTSRHEASDEESFGREVLGPITADFCIRAWLYVRQAEATHRPVVLFCARGGLGMRVAFERALSRYRLPLDAGRETFLISRLVAARAALLNRSPAAIDEMKREFRRSTIAEVANALTSRIFELPPQWKQPFDGDRFVELVFGPSGVAVLDDIRAQHELFVEHLDAVCGDADRIILCDTGLYGSTQRMLAAGFPDRSFETILLARANYKQLDASHFARVTGLVSQSDRFNPLDDRTYVLRYWHLIEHLFELGQQSVRTFYRTPEGMVASNLDVPVFGNPETLASHPLLKGALAFLEEGPSIAAEAFSAAEPAWAKLRKAITRPTLQDVALLGGLERSSDFGRSDRKATVEAQLGLATPRERLRWIKHQLWREGSLVRAFPRLGPVYVRLFSAALFVQSRLKRR